MITDTVFAELFTESEKMKREAAALLKKRNLFDEVKPITGLMVGIYGLRGTGKTTLLLQLANEKENSFYINTENLVFKGISIVEFIEFAEKKGFTSFFIDEIHTYSSWSSELKLLYDRGIRDITFSGSSSLKIQEKAADLSRRALLFYLPPLSFREFLSLAVGAPLEKTVLEDIIDFKKRKELIVRLTPYIRYFDEYMKFGSFPFYISQKDNAYPLYRRIIEKIVRVDLTSTGKIDVDYIDNAYKLINTLAVSNPNEMNYNFLAKQIGRNIYYTEIILHALSEVGFINTVMPLRRGAALLRKEPKFLLAPTFRLTLAQNLGFSFEQVIGGIREDIFTANTYLLNPRYMKTERERKTPDYVINGMSFELGTHKYKCSTDFYVKEQLIIDEKVIPLPLFCMLF